MKKSVRPVARLFHCLIAAVCLAALPLSHAAVINVSTSSQLATAVANANPGDDIVLANGNYSGFKVTRSGTAASPIVIEAASQSGAVITSGIIQFSSCSFVTVKGLKLTTPGGSLTVDGVSRNVGVVFTSAKSSQVTRCKFALAGTPSGTQWVFLGGNSQSNRIDHCEFGPNSVDHAHYIFPCGSTQGITLPSCRDGWANGQGPYNPNMARFTQIDHNYFHDMASGDGETIVLGGIGQAGDYQGLMSVVEWNLFVNCDGDPEIVSVKSSTNTIRFNTVKSSAGVFSLRAGNGSSIYGNFFLCAGSGGGVKVNEKHHKVYNNYIENTDSGNYPIMLESGDDYCGGSFAHGQVVDCQVTHNTIVNAGREVRIGHGSGTLQPTGVVLANNIITGSGTLYSEDSGTVITRSQNIVNGTNPNKSGFIVENPLFTGVSENGSTIQKLSSGSPAIGAANTSFYSYVSEDMDGQARGTSKDIGADEFSTGTIDRKPLSTADVGVNAPGDGDFSLAASPTSISIMQGQSGTSTITETDLNGFSGSVSLSASGLPSGVTATFNPTSTTSTSTLTLTASGSAATGTFTVTVTGTGNGITHTTTVSLTINPAPNFSVSASPSSQTVTAGNSADYTVSVNSLNGYTGTVNFSVSGLPANATASFSPTSVSGAGSSTLTVNTATSTPAGTYTLTITGTDGTLTHTVTITLIVNPVGGGSLPAGWTDADVGAVGLAGSASFNNGTFTVSGSGADIFTSGDQFHYAYQSVSGDLTIVSRVVSETQTAAFAKAGVMIRETLATNSVEACVLLTPTNGVAMEFRPTTGAATINITGWIKGPQPPQWVKLVRAGSSFTGYYSADGSTWTQIATTNITMAADVVAGLAVTAHNNAALNTATFDNVSITAGNVIDTSRIYKIQNVASGLVLNNQGSLTNGSKITQWTATTVSSNLVWTLIPTSNGYYQINSVKSGKDAVVQGASTAAGAGIVQWDFGTSGDDQWKPVANGDGSYTFFNLHSGLVLGDPAGSTSTSTQMDQETANGGSNQKWVLLPQ